MKNIELNRKLLHISSFWIPILINLFPQRAASCILFVCAIFLICIDLLKNYSDKFKIFFNNFFRKVLREDEKNKYFTGATYFIIGSYITFLMFNTYIAATAIIILIMSDTFASYIGINYGKLRFWHKSLEGSTAFFISTLIIVNLANYCFKLNYHLLKIFYISIFTTLIELCSAKIYINDNLSIPITAGICMSYINNV